MVATSDTTVHNWAKAQIIKEAEELAAFKQTFDAGAAGPDLRGTSFYRVAVVFLAPMVPQTPRHISYSLKSNSLVACADSLQVTDTCECIFLWRYLQTMRQQ